DDVAGLEPAVVRPAALGLLGHAEVRAGDPRPAHLELAHHLAVPRHEPVLVARAYLDERRRQTLLRAEGVLLLDRQLPDLAGRLGDRPERAHLGHPPRLADVQTVPLLEALDHRPGSRGAADDPPPDRRQFV